LYLHHGNGNDDASTILPGGTIRLTSNDTTTTTTRQRRRQQHAAAAAAVETEDGGDDTIGMGGTHRRPIFVSTDHIIDNNDTSSLLHNNYTTQDQQKPLYSGNDVVLPYGNDRAIDFLNAHDTSSEIQNATRPPWAPPLDAASAAKLAAWTRVELRDELEMRRSAWYRFAVLVAGRAGVSIETLVRIHNLVTPPSTTNYTGSGGGLRPFGYPQLGFNGDNDTQQQPPPPPQPPGNDRIRPTNLFGLNNDPITPPREVNINTSPLPPQRQRQSNLDDSQDVPISQVRQGYNAGGVIPSSNVQQQQQQQQDVIRLARLRNEVAELELRARRTALLDDERSRALRVGAQWMNRSVATGVAFLSPLLVAQRDKASSDLRDEYPDELGDVLDERAFSESDDSEVRSRFADLVAVGITVAQYMGARRLGHVTDYTRAYADARRAAVERFRYVRARDTTNTRNYRKMLYADRAAKSLVRSRQHAQRTGGVQQQYVRGPISGGAVPQWRASASAVPQSTSSTGLSKFRRLDVAPYYAQ